MAQVCNSCPHSNCLPLAQNSHHNSFCENPRNHPRQSARTHKHLQLYSTSLSLLLKLRLKLLFLFHLPLAPYSNSNSNCSSSTVGASLQLVPTLKLSSIFLLLKPHTQTVSLHVKSVKFHIFTRTKRYIP